MLIDTNFSVEESGVAVPVALDQVRRPQYGRLLEAFTPGTKFLHPRGLTIYPSFAQEFATTFMQANPLYLNAPYARAVGFPAVPVPPLMVLNVILSLGVQNISEQAIAHLGYYDLSFLQAVYPGDTLYAESLVLSRRFRGSKPGIVRVRTTGKNQEGHPVIRYERAVLIPAAEANEGTNRKEIETIDDAESSSGFIQLPIGEIKELPPLTGDVTYFEDFKIGEIIIHGNGRTITDEHMSWSYRLGNTHPLHNDRIYSGARTGPMSGEPIVYGGLVFAWLEGLSSRDLSENALWDLGYSNGYHTQPARSGDTLFAVSRIVAKQDGPLGTGILTRQLIGLKNFTGHQALDQFGAALFYSENGKPPQERIDEKLFEIKGRLLIKKRQDWRAGN